MKKATLLSLVLFLGISASAQWTNSGSNIYNTNAGNVGIGVTNPTFKLAVDGIIHTTNFLLSDAAQPGQAGAWFRGATNGNGNIIIQGGGGNYHAYWLSGANGLFKIGGNGATEPAAGAINITSDGKVGIGTTNPGSFKLAVEGRMIAREVKVTLQTPFPDYVFTSSYKLRDLHSLEKYIQLNHHLPGIPSATEVEKEGGISLGEMNAKLLEKIEELTLYVIELKKENESMKETLKELSEKK